jgi:2,3-bisphosphoglycerate-independent phosphoglycerate mutase
MKMKPAKLLLKARFGSIDKNGNLLAREVMDKDAEYLAEVIDFVEIDGVRFSARVNDGVLEITMEGSDLSPNVTVNYTTKINVVKQIVHKTPGANFTSSVLNKFVRKTNKMLSNEPCNREKREPPNIVLIKEIEEIAGGETA